MGKSTHEFQYLLNNLHLSSWKFRDDTIFKTVVISRLNTAMATIYCFEENPAILLNVRWPTRVNAIKNGLLQTER